MTDKLQSKYVPTTFETMMEHFGINLQRKTLIDNYFEKINEVEEKIKSKETNSTEISNDIKEIS